MIIARSPAPVRVRALVVLLVGLAVLNGCGSGSGSGPNRDAASAPGAPHSATVPAAVRQALAASAMGFDPCKLVTQEEAAAAAGQPLQQVEREGGKCHYENADTGRNFTVEATRHASKDAARKDFDLDRQVNKSAEDVSGLGDAAFFSAGLSAITVLSGDVTVEVQLVREDQLESKQLRATVMDLARKVLQRLKAG